jgi:gas vesicle protein
MKKTKKMSLGKKVALGAGMAALGAGAYYLLGPKGKENQKKLLVLAGKMKKEVEKEIKKAKTATLPVYNKIVDTVSSNYAKQYNLHEKDIKAFAKKMKDEWKKAKKTVKSATKKKVR